MVENVSLVDTTKTKHVKYFLQRIVGTLKFIKHICLRKYNTVKSMLEAESIAVRCLSSIISSRRMSFHADPKGALSASVPSQAIVWANREVEAELARIAESKHKKRGPYIRYS